LITTQVGARDRKGRCAVLFSLMYRLNQTESAIFCHWCFRGNTLFPDVCLFIAMNGKRPPVVQIMFSHLYGNNYFENFKIKRLTLLTETGINNVYIFKLKINWNLITSSILQLSSQCAVTQNIRRFHGNYILVCNTCTIKVLTYPFSEIIHV
jgi:hypothetical protein